MPAPIANLLGGIPGELPTELADTLVSHRAVRIERIVSRGHRTPPDTWYDQVEHEWVLLLTGAARLTFANASAPVELEPGDHVHIAPHVRHRVDWTPPDRDTIWLAVYFS